MSQMTAEPHSQLEHSLLEDGMAFAIGSTMAALSVAILTHLGLVTGQTAGLNSVWRNERHRENRSPGCRGTWWVLHKE